VKEERAAQWIAAARTVNNKTTRRRRLVISNLLRRLMRRANPDPIVSASLFCLHVGTVPGSLWEEA
jgi:hypothetical protein